MTEDDINFTLINIAFPCRPHFSTSRISGNR
jgi:hypothetical protein